MNGPCIRILVGLCGVAAGGVCWAQQTATWLNPVSGLWSNPSSWSGGVVPNNAGPNTFIAEILVGGNFDVSVDVDVALSGLSLAATGAQLKLSGVGRSMTTNGANLFEGVDIMGDANTTINAGGNTVMQGGGRVANVSGFTFGGTVDFLGTDDIDLCDTCVNITGDGGWGGGLGFTLEGVSGSSEIVVEQGGSLSLTGTGDRRITGMGVLNRFVNRGQLTVDLDDLSGTMDIDSALMVNDAGGSINVARGKIASNAFGSVSLGRLNGGDWKVGDQGEVDLLGVQITETAVRVELSGAGSAFGAIDSLGAVLAGGAFSINNGRDFATDIAASTFDVQGTLEVGAGSKFTVTSTLANIDAGALRAGRFVVGGELELDTGNITTLGADLVLDGAGAIVAATGGANLLTTLDDIEAAGTLELKGGAGFATVGDLTLAGALKVRSGSAMTVNGDLSAFQNGTFSGAAIEVGGDVLADNTKVQRVEGRLVVGRNGRLLMDDTGGPVDGLVFLERVESGGTFGLDGGRELDLTAMDNTVEVGGTLVLGSSGLEGPMNTGSVLLADAITQETGSTLSIGIGAIRDFGRVETGLATFGLGDPGSVAGELNLVLGAGYTAAFGDEFLVIDLTPMGSILGGGFASLTVDGVLGGGLFFEQFITSDGLGVRVVPAPGVGVALLGGLIASRRRRA